ncbi:MAG: hypothetical protein HYW48_02770 [Deltaproteobacteria bacterium]|nr:hypothetical protein [Deltaproteobacteria bacterium]
MNNIVLIDTSVWAEYWKSKKHEFTSAVEILLFEGNIASCYLIKAELASAQIARRQVLRILDSLDYAVSADLDYNQEGVAYDPHP